MTKSKQIEQEWRTQQRKENAIVDSQIEDIERKIADIRNADSYERYRILQSIARNATKAVGIIEV